MLLICPMKLCAYFFCLALNYDCLYCFCLNHICVCTRKQWQHMLSCDLALCVFVWCKAVSTYSFWPLITFIYFACQGPCSLVPLHVPLYEENQGLNPPPPLVTLNYQPNKEKENPFCLSLYLVCMCIRKTRQHILGCDLAWGVMPLQYVAYIQSS